MSKHGLRDEEWSIDDDALLLLIRRYTREAGVRNLERELSTLARKAVKELMTSKQKSVRVTAENLGDYVGVPKHRHGEIEAEDMVGMVTGLAWTDVGGELLTIEGVMMPGKGRMTVTGNLRDVMKGIDLGGGVLCALPGGCVRHRGRRCSTGATSTCTRSRGRDPEGRPVGRASPLVTAIVSVMTGIPVRRDGDDRRDHAARRVLPISGLKEKLLRRCAAA